MELRSSRPLLLVSSLAYIWGGVHFRDFSSRRFFPLRLRRHHVQVARLPYNREWRLEKLRYKSPFEARRDYQSSSLLAA